jgi:hypothetical protein
MMDVAVNQEGWVEEVRPGSADPEREFREAGRKYLRALEQELDACKSKVTRLDVALHAAITERDAVHAKVDALHDLLTTHKTSAMAAAYGGKPAPSPAPPTAPNGATVTSQVLGWVGEVAGGREYSIAELLSTLALDARGLYDAMRDDKSSQMSEVLRKGKYARVRKGVYYLPSKEGTE